MKSTASALAALALALPAAAQDAPSGEMLYATYCATCHTERLHARGKSKVKTLAQLRDEVARWAPQTRRRFTLDELEAVAQHLNRTHYKLGE